MTGSRWAPSCDHKMNGDGHSFLCFSIRHLGSCYFSFFFSSGLQDDGADHLGRKGKAAQRKFMDNLGYFLRELIVEGQEALVFSEEEGGVESILDLATALSW